MTLLGSIATIATLIALCIAIWQSLEARRQTNALRGIHSSLTTRYLGPYPDFLSAIVPLLESAKDSLTILVDCPAYAGFSFPDQELRARQAIEKKLADPGSHVRIVTRTPQGRRDATRQQFPREDSKWKEWCERPTSRERLTRFLGVGVVPSTVIYQDFEDAVEEGDRSAIERFRSTAKIKGNVATGRLQILEDPRPIPVNIWIVDGRRAVFALISFSSGATEYGFETSDARLIAALEGIVEDVVRTSPSISTMPGSPNRVTV